MKRFAVLGLILAAFALGCTAQQQAAVQGDIAKLQADLQAKKAALVPQLQAGIAYAQKAGDVEWATCQQGLLTIIQSPAAHRIL